jgi:hypothetical protein
VGEKVMIHLVSGLQVEKHEEKHEENRRPAFVQGWVYEEG